MLIILIKFYIKVYLYLELSQPSPSTPSPFKDYKSIIHKDKGKGLKFRVKVEYPHILMEKSKKEEIF
jgi:hypothetical protein